MNLAHGCTETRVSEIESRVKALEAELAVARATLTVTRTRVLSEQRVGMADEAVMSVVRTAAPSPHRAFSPKELADVASDAAEELPDIMIQLLLPHDPLRRKWHLGAGLPSAGFCRPARLARGQVGFNSGQLRIYGLLSDGSPWEEYIRFGDLIKVGGVTIGRESSQCDIVLDDESVSRVHARLEITSQGLVVSDLNSTNGSLVNENRVDYYSSQVPLTDGATLKLGEVPLRVEFLTNNTDT